MNPKSLFTSPPPKLKSFKNDIAPIGFYFDLFTTDLFKIPVMPIPMRIDKISNGQPTFFVFPDIIKLNKLCEKLDLSINFDLFFIIGIKNLLNFARKKYKEITFRMLGDKKITNWFNNSKFINADIPYLTDDFTFLISEFLTMYSKIDPDKHIKDYSPEIIQYCDIIIKFFKQKIENNILQIKNENMVKKEKLYEERENKYFPNILHITIYNSYNQKWKKMNYVPYLIYDDIFDSFTYNKKLLLEHNKTPFNLQLWQKNHIINNGSKTKKFDSKKFLNNINIEEIKLG